MAGTTGTGGSGGAAGTGGAGGGGGTSGAGGAGGSGGAGGAGGRGGAEKRRAFLTFDDGPVPNTSKVLDILGKAKVHATFFVNGIGLQHKQDLQYSILRRMLDEGNSIGNHGFDHDPMRPRDYKKTPVDEVKADFTGNLRYLSDVFKEHHDKFPPFQVARLPVSGFNQPNF